MIPPDHALALPDQHSLSSLAEQATDYAREAKAENTRRAYRSDWRAFSEWCEMHDRNPLPATPETLCLYLSAAAETLRASSIQRRLSSIAVAHQAAGFDTPTRAPAVRLVWQGIRRVKGTRQEGKAPALTSDLRRMVEALPPTLAGLRDRTLLVMGLACGFRRSELVSLGREDVTVTREGVRVLLRRSKTDQEGEGRTVGLPYGACPDTCPVRTLQEWLKKSGIKSGPLFRPVDRYGRLRSGGLSGQTVALIVKRAAKAAGLDPARYAGHSLRAGHATSARLGGADEASIMKQTGHRSTQQLRKYFREADLWRMNSAAKLGL